MLEFRGQQELSLTPHGRETTVFAFSLGGGQVISGWDEDVAE